MANSHELKRHEAEIRRLEAKQKGLQDAIANTRKELNMIAHQLHVSKERLKSLNKQCGLIVSDHAIVRFFERVKGINISTIKEEICGSDPAKLNPINGIFPVNSHRIVIRDGVLTTVET